MIIKGMPNFRFEKDEGGGGGNAELEKEFAELITPEEEPAEIKAGEEEVKEPIKEKVIGEEVKEPVEKKVELIVEPKKVVDPVKEWEVEKQKLIAANVEVQKKLDATLALVTKPKVEDKSRVEKPVAEPTFDDLIEVTQEDMNDLLSADPVKFSSVVKKFAKTIHDLAVNTIITNVRKVDTQKQETDRYVKASRDKFFGDYPDLVDYPDLTMLVATEVLTKNPGKYPHEVFEDIAKEVREKIAYVLEKNKIEEKPRPRALTKGGEHGGTKQEVHTPRKLTEEEKEMEDLAKEDED